MFFNALDVLVDLEVLDLFLEWLSFDLPYNMVFEERKIEMVVGFLGFGRE